MTAIYTTTGTSTGNGNQTTRHSHQWVLVLIDAKYQTNRKLHHFRQDCFEHYTEEELVQIQEDCRDGGLATNTDDTNNDDDEGNDDSSLSSMLSMKSISSSLTSGFSLSLRRKRRRSSRWKQNTAGTMIPAQITSKISSSSSWDDGDGHNSFLLDDSSSPSDSDEKSAANYSNTGRKVAATTATSNSTDAWRYLEELEKEHSFSEETLDVLRSWVVQ